MPIKEFKIKKKRQQLIKKNHEKMVMNRNKNYLDFPLNMMQSSTRQQMKPATDNTTIRIKVFLRDSFRSLAAGCCEKKREKVK